ncbi:MAG: phosphonate ABC transporter, permease protein PhnE [Myxococcota bacterium]|jgi:phosphonate transport system permease protein|nr:phosphonate ABC transporter, permease protein PhnE [Myxococcota bacterium]
MTIRVDNLRLIYATGGERPVRALDEVSFQIEQGERVAIIGRSGSGKTSLLRILAGLIEPTDGEVVVAGHDLAASRPERDFYTSVGVMFQDYGLVRQLPAITNVLCGTLHGEAATSHMLDFSKEQRDRALELLDALGLKQRARTRSAKLSGGEQQRVGLCRLLMQSPAVMLLDEPIASLDVHWAEVALGKLEESTETTSIVILHDLEMARRWATRVLLIDRGKLAFDGDPEEGCALLESSKDTDTKTTQREQDTPDEQPSSMAPREEDAPSSRAAFYIVGLLATVGLYVWALDGLNLSASKLFGSMDNARNFLSRMLPPDPSVTGTVFDALLETIQMALVGTTMAAIFALPISIAAARNTSPLPLRIIARFILNFMRTIPSIIWGLFFVAIVGLGPFPGVLALTFYATGYLGKFFYEGIESIDLKPLVALRTTGASRLHVFRYGVFPQVLPLLTSYTIYMFEYNVRAASILGVVGAGGVGFYLYSYINNFTYTKAATTLLMLLALVTVIDAASSRIRAKFNI